MALGGCLAPGKLLCSVQLQLHRHFGLLMMPCCTPLRRDAPCRPPRSGCATGPCATPGRRLDTLRMPCSRQVEAETGPLSCAGIAACVTDKTRSTLPPSQSWLRHRPVRDSRAMPRYFEVALLQAAGSCTGSLSSAETAFCVTNKTRRTLPPSQIWRRHRPVRDSRITPRCLTKSCSRRWAVAL